MVSKMHFAVCGFFAFFFAAFAWAGVPDVVLVIFTSPESIACRQMSPLFEELVARQYPISHVNAAESPELVAKYNVTSFPTLIAFAKGEEVDRVVGSADPMIVKPRVVRMFEQAKNHVANASPIRTVSHTTWQNESAPHPFSTTTEQNSAREKNISAARIACDQSSVRIKVLDQNGFSWGTGTIIDARQGSALVLTCGHIFRSVQNGLRSAQENERANVKIEVHLFENGISHTVEGRCLRYNLECDLALIEIRTPYAVTASPLAPERYPLQCGQRVTSIGCDGGNQPTSKQHQVLSLDRISTPTKHQKPFYYIQVSGAPVSGRSGGGLFTEDGYLVGVCNTADPQVDDGHFVPPHIIRQELDAANLSLVHLQPSLGDESIASASSANNSLALNEPARLTQLAQQTLVAQPLSSPENSSVIQAGFGTTAQRNEVGFRDEVGLRGGLQMTGASSAMPPQIISSAPSIISHHEEATLQEIQRRQEAGDEVIVIVRPRNNPQAPSDVIVLKNVSDPFLSAIAHGTPISTIP